MLCWTIMICGDLSCPLFLDVQNGELVDSLIVNARLYKARNSRSGQLGQRNSIRGNLVFSMPENKYLLQLFCCNFELLVAAKADSYNSLSAASVVTKIGQERISWFFHVFTCSCRVPKSNYFLRRAI
jgi:hypothetical protein